ncbi:MAG TPA: tetratricopeptide repeat protein, partial [Polyangiaceae bacterium]
RERAAAPLMEKAEEYAAVGDHMRAEQYFSAALSRGAGEQRVLPLLVRECIADERYRSATQYLEEYLRRHPTQHNARFLLASLHLSLGQAEVAKRELMIVLRALPQHADAHYALATLLRDHSANYAGADAHFREYLALRPDGSHAEEARGSLLVTVPDTSDGGI